MASELDEYDYELPSHLIASAPVRVRSDARMLVADRSSHDILHRHVRDLPDFLRAGDALVINDTKVVPASLEGYREATGGRWQGLFLSADERGCWRLLGTTRGKLQGGEQIVLQDLTGQDACRLTLLTKWEDGTWIARPGEERNWEELLQQVGRVPLPPYIRHGKMVEADRQRYQTVYADKPGAVAAPTAGLHFTPQLLAQLEAMGVSICRTTLHVGAGTFRPISAERLEDHAMHFESGVLSDQAAATLNEVRSFGGRVIAVGTTSVRVLETAVDSSGRFFPWSGKTNLFIRPPYDFKGVDALMTNFHLPKSTLLVLVRTYGTAELIQRAYKEAIAEEYRFYSYGDAMLIV